MPQAAITVVIEGNGKTSKLRKRVTMPQAAITVVILRKQKLI